MNEQETRDRERWAAFFRTWTDPKPPEWNSPRTAVWKKNKATLWHYPPVHRKYRVPLFLIYSLVNRPTILDLAPGHSIIETFTCSGFDVYLLDFGLPGYEDKDLTLDDYIVDYVQKGVRRALRHAGANEISIIGYCLGGTLAAIYAAIAEEPIKNVILSVAPIDFAGFPVLDAWGEALRAGDIDFDLFIQAYGIIPARWIEAGMRLLTSPVYFSPYLSLLQRAPDPHYVEKWRRFNEWTRGHIPFAGAALRQLIHDLVKENKLIKGTLTIRGTKAHLASIHASTLVVAAKLDRLVPKEVSLPIMDHIASTDKTVHLVPGGHTALKANGTLPDYLAAWLPKRSHPFADSSM